MTFRKMILGASSVSCIFLSVAAVLPASLALSGAAQAQTSISVSIGIDSFYNRLEPYGSWVSFHDQYVFLPRDVDSDWRPYTRGHWSYTRHYGWLWVSSERFGWATYHYGRWGYSRDIGWYWVPGHRWAPAWVAWSHGQNEIAWAPLPPDNGDDFGMNVTFGDLPDYYWQAVPVAAFLSINISNRVIRDRNLVRTVVQQGRPEAVRIENNAVVNNVIHVNDIERATHTKVKVLDEKPATTPDAVGKTDLNSVAIFNPEVKVDTNAKPQKPVAIDQVVAGRKTRGLKPLDVPADTPAAPAQKSGSSTQAPSPAVQPPAALPVPKGTKSTNDVPLIKSDKTAPGLQKPLDTGKMKNVPRGKPVVQPKLGNGATAPVAPAGQSKNKKPKDTAPRGGAKPNGQMKQNGQPVPDQKAKGQNGKRDKKIKCDPNVETCPPAN